MKTSYDTLLRTGAMALLLPAFAALPLPAAAQSTHRNHVTAAATSLKALQPGRHTAPPLNGGNTVFEGSDAGFDLYVACKELGQPCTISQQSFSAGQGRFMADLVANMSYNAQGRVSEALITDSATGTVKGKLLYTYTPAGEVQTYTVQLPTGPGNALENSTKETYLFDSQNKYAGYDTWAYTAGTPRLTDGMHRASLYDAQNRLFIAIDSTFSADMGRLVVSGKTEYHYPGTDTAPDVYIVSDTGDDRHAGFTPILRVDELEWSNFERNWMAAGTLSTPGAVGGWQVQGTYTGTGTALQWTTVTSFLFDVSQPAIPILRTTQAYNTQGDYILARSESYTPDAANPGTGTWGTNYEARYDHAYNRPGGKVSSMTFSQGQGGEAVTPQKRYLYYCATATAVKGEAAAPVQLYPNPAKGTVRISGKASAQGTVLSATGRQVHSFTLGADGTATLPLDGLATGVYQVRLGNGAAARLVVE